MKLIRLKLESGPGKIFFFNDSGAEPQSGADTQPNTFPQEL